MEESVSNIFQVHYELNELIYKAISELDYTLVYKIENKFINLLEEIQTLLIIKHDLYYGHFLMNIKYSFYYDENFLAAVTFQNRVVELIINPIKLGQMEIKKLIFVLCHEIEHLIYGHHFDMINMNPHKDKRTANLLNIAMDASVNDKLIDDIKKGFNLIEFDKSFIDSTWREI